ncbi:sulfotransferase 1B1-like [Glandiceps talaboti]
MKADLDSNVRAIADHLECKLSDDVIKRISEECTFKSMKERKVREGISQTLHVEKGKSLFFRKGEIGNWKQHFTVAQSEAFDKWLETVIGESGLTFRYE